MGQTSHPQPRHKDPPVTLAVQYQDQDQNQEERTQEAPDFISQVIQRAREEWETFHLEHPEIDEETFVAAQRFCLKQWLLEHETALTDLPALERAEEHFAYEVQQRAVGMQAILEVMADPIYTDAQCMGLYIATQAQERSKRIREAIKEVSTNQTYVVGKIHQLRAPEQTQKREQEVQQRLQEVRQDIENIKASGIALLYENQKGGLKQREQAMREHMSMLGHLRDGDHQLGDVSRSFARWEECLKSTDILMKDLHKQTLETYRKHSAVGMVPDDENAAKQRARQARVQVETVQAFIRQMQEGIQDALTRARAEILHKRFAKQAHERMNHRHGEIEIWAQEEVQQAEARKKKLKEGRDSYINIMIKARNDVFSEHARSPLRPDTPGKPGSGYQRVYPRMKASEGLVVDTQANDAADEAELETIYQQGKRRAAAPPDPAQPGTGAGLGTFRCAERFVQAKAIDRAITTEEKLIHSIERARNKTQETLAHFKEIYACYHDINEIHLKIADKSVKCIKFFEKAKRALERAICAAEATARDTQQACDKDPEVDAKHMQKRARYIAREELQAYVEIKKYGTYALHSLRDIATEYSNLQEKASVAMTHFEALLADTFPFEQEVLDRAITGVKQIVKASMQLLRAEEQAKEAAHQTATAIETGLSANLTRSMANEQEVLLLAALANDALKAYATSYYTSHALAVHIAQENLQATLETSTEQFLSALEVVKKEVDEITRQKESKDRERQAAAADDSLRRVHLLINEQSGGLTLEDEEAVFRLQDLARLAAEGQGATLSLPNGTHIKLADIDVEQSTYDPINPERGLTIVLKQDRQPPNAHGGPWQINLLAAAAAMTTSLTPEALRELMNRNLDEHLHRLRSAVEAKDLTIIEDCFNDIRLSDIYKYHIDKYIISSEERNHLQQDLDEWMKGVAHAANSIAEIVRTYAYKALDSECGEKEITESYALTNGLSIDESDEMYRNRVACFQKIAEGRGLDTIITCQLFQDPDDPSAGTYSSPTVQELLMEYERAAACHVLERQEKRASDKWTQYLARLRHAILDQAPLFFCAQFLADQVKQAVQAGRWEEGTAENPAIPQLAQELEALGQQDRPENNEYASAVHVFIQRVAAGLQRALKTENPSNILAKVSLLDLALAALDQVEEKVLEALEPTTPTALARQLVEQIGTSRGSGTQDDGISKEERDNE